MKFSIKNISRMSVIKNSFLLPILLVVIMSISHVTLWYDLGNPMSWAVYLSVAIEIFALASVSAASVNINRGSVWFLFGLVTTIQIIGNIFFEYNDIDIKGGLFKSWMEMVLPIFPDWDAVDHRRFLAAIQGGTLPLMSLTALHYYIKFGDKMREDDTKKYDVEVSPVDDTKERQTEIMDVQTDAVPHDVEQEHTKEDESASQQENAEDGDDIAVYANN